MMIRRFCLTFALTAAATPAFAQQEDPLAPVEQDEDRPVLTTPEPATPPPPVVRPVVVPKDWRGVFAAIRSGDWGSAAAGIESDVPIVVIRSPST